MKRKWWRIVRLVGLLAFAGGLALAGCSYEDIPAFVSSCTQSNQAPLVPTAPTGPSTGDAGTSYQFSTATTDPEGDTVSYEFDWDDGTAYGSSGCLASGATATISHTYTADGTYDVRARATDIQGATSGWSSEHEIVIGAGGDGGGTEEGSILWQYTLSDVGPEPLASSHPAIAPNGTIYVTASGTTGTWTSRLVALNANGTEK